MAENDFYSLDGAKNVAILQIRCSMLVSGCVEYFCFSSSKKRVELCISSWSGVQQPCIESK